MSLRRARARVVRVSGKLHGRERMFIVDRCTGVAPVQMCGTPDLFERVGKHVFQLYIFILIARYPLRASPVHERRRCSTVFAHVLLTWSCSLFHFTTGAPRLYFQIPFLPSSSPPPPLPPVIFFFLFFFFSFFLLPFHSFPPIWPYFWCAWPFTCTHVSSALSRPCQPLVLLFQKRRTASILASIHFLKEEDRIVRHDRTWTNS